MLRYIFMVFIFSFFSFANISTSFNKHANILGNFSFTVTDFDLQVGGLPVQVNRTYSTLQRTSKLDFGYAWSVDYQNVKIEESMHPGERVESHT
ncbi:MAG: DUF6531 domain-containing protein [Campylobacterota bacterium]|nr:DUF6531 domain-containing protein [Campylobacterota bacterium]